MKLPKWNEKNISLFLPQAADSNSKTCIFGASQQQFDPSFAQALYLIVGFIQFFIFCFLVKVTKNEKIGCHFQAKCRFFIQEIIKQDSWFFVFVFGHFDQKTKNEKWNEPDNRQTFVVIRYVHITNLRNFASILSGIIERFEEQLESLHRALH